jgi:ribosomal protein S18 acetylase RimI-like enzyme
MIRHAEPPSPPVLRLATVADAPAMAALHLVAWRGAYRDLAPAKAWETLDEAVRRERWTRTLSQPPARQAVLIAELDGAMVGFGAAVAPTEAVFGDRGEVRHLYVDPAAQGRGIGRRLMAALADQIAGWGYGGLALAVVEGNDGAMAFYRRLGGREAGRFTDPGPIWKSDNRVFVWDDLAPLRA